MCFHLKQKASGKTEKVRPSALITISLDMTDFTFYSEEEEKLVSYGQNALLVFSYALDIR